MIREDHFLQAERAMDPTNRIHKLHGSYSQHHRIAFARASISRAKMDLLRLADRELTQILEEVQKRFKLKYAKNKGR